MLNLIFIFIGAGFGGVFRYLVSIGSYSLLGRQFPYGTLVVNTTGCLLMGFLFVLILDRFSDFAPQLRSFLLIGFLGGYTTFSSFSIETLNLLEQGEWFSAILNILLNVVLCLFLAWIGILGGRQL